MMAVAHRFGIARARSFQSLHTRMSGLRRRSPQCSNMTSITSADTATRIAAFITRVNPNPIFHKKRQVLCSRLTLDPDSPHRRRLFMRFERP